MPSSKELTEQWYRDTGNRQHLESLLQDPVLVFALRILQAKASEPVPPVSGTACDLTQYGAMIGFSRNGAFDTLKNLESLAKNPPAKPVEVRPFDRSAQLTAAGIRDP